MNNRNKTIISLLLSIALILVAVSPAYASVKKSPAGREDVAECIEYSLASISSLDEGRDYARNELVFMAKNREEARMAAREYHGTLASYHEDTGIGVIYVGDGVEEALETASVDAENIHIKAEPNYICHICGNTEISSFSGYNDPLLTNNLMWYFDKVNAPTAHSMGFKGNGIKVAVIDSGISLSHEDLQGKVDNKYSCLDTANRENVEDDNGHGSHCAGLIAATKNNGKGGVGIAPDVTLDIYKAGDRWGSYLNSDVADAIIRAADNDADVISMSFGGYYYSTIEHSAIKYAYNKGVVLVAGAGNGSTREWLFPASYHEVLSVAASGYYSESSNSCILAWYSNYGDNVDVVAPGGDHVRGNENDTTSAISNGRYADLLEDSHDSIISSWRNGKYNMTSGTSMACPIVAGIAALALQKYPDIAGLNDARTSDTIKDHIISTANGQIYYSADGNGCVRGGMVRADEVLKDENRPRVHQNTYPDDYPYPKKELTKEEQIQAYKDQFPNRIYFDDNCFIEVVSDNKYIGKKIKPEVTIGRTIANIDDENRKYEINEIYDTIDVTSNNKKRLKVKYKDNKNAGMGKVIIKKCKDYPELKGKELTFEISPIVVSNNNIKVKMKDTTVKNVKVDTNGKYKKVPKKMWRVNGSNLDFSGNYTGSVSVNELV